MIYLAVELDAGPLRGSDSNQHWFDSLSVRWFLVDGSVPSQKSLFVLSLIPHIRSWASQEALFLCFSLGTIAHILLTNLPLGKEVASRPPIVDNIAVVSIFALFSLTIARLWCHNGFVFHRKSLPKLDRPSQVLLTYPKQCARHSFYQSGLRVTTALICPWARAGDNFHYNNDHNKCSF